jgi:stalled ribosome rescue protein Dom34
MKYLVKVIYETITETVEGVETTRDTNVVDSYVVKYITNSNHKPRGGHYVFIESEVKLLNPSVSTDVDGNLILVEGPATVKDKYDEMVTDVYAQMLSTFGTTNDISASAFAATYEAMKVRPANYVDTDLGLADEAAVIAYADTKLSAADAYGVYRLKRIAQYQAEKAVILGE